MANRGKILVAASVAGLLASTSMAMAGASFPGQDSMKKAPCSMNGCKGAASCKTEKHSCSSGNSCNGQSKSKTPTCNFSAKVKNGKLTS